MTTEVELTEWQTVGKPWEADCTHCGSRVVYARQKKTGVTGDQQATVRIISRPISGTGCQQCLVNG